MLRLSLISGIITLPLIIALSISFGFSGELFFGVLATFIEAFSLLTILIYLRNKFKIKALTTVVFAFLVLIYVAQSITLFTTHSYLTPLAIDNANSIMFIMPYYQLALIILVIIALGVAIEWFAKSSYPKLNVVLSLLVIFIASSILLHSPVHTLSEAYFAGINYDDIPYDETMAEYKRFNTDIENEEYPLLKMKVYDNELEFKGNGNENIIILFPDGISSRMVGAYGCEYPNITPNIDKFASNPKVMQVNDLFNHTASTYRGMKGIFNSLYPIQGVYHDKSEHFSVYRNNIFNILQDKGYKATFLHPHTASHFDSFVESFGIDTLYSQEDNMELFLDGKATIINGFISDEDIYKSLIEYLKQSNPDEKQIISVYMLGTHAFIDVPENGKRYEELDARPLNKLHNQDYWFGKFLEYFEKSPYYDNTYLILATDHCTYPEPPYVEVANAPYPLVHYVDSVPLLIYDPNGRLPKTLDANKRTQIDIAPTLLHVLGVNNVPNVFLGKSLFEEGNWTRKLAVIGKEVYKIDDDGVVHIVDVEELEHEQQVRLLMYLAIENRDKLSPPNE